VRYKLFNSNTFKPDDKCHASELLSAVRSLDVCLRTREALDLVNASISSHLRRWILDFSLDSENIETNCPLEPIVAETVVWILNHEWR
jgi:hypothetical protein